MSIDAISSVGASSVEAPGAPTNAPDVAGGAFESLMQQIESLNTRMHAGQESVAQLALGQADNLHQVIMSSEQTRLSFELMLAVRNKVLEAYQELMRMQV